MFPVPGKFGALWYTTWQLCCENNPNDLGYMKYTIFSYNLCESIIMSYKMLQLHISWQL